MTLVTLEFIASGTAGRNSGSENFTIRAAPRKCFVAKSITYVHTYMRTYARGARGKMDIVQCHLLYKPFKVARWRYGKVCPAHPVLSFNIDTPFRLHGRQTRSNGPGWNFSPIHTVHANPVWSFATFQEFVSTLPRDLDLLKLSEGLGKRSVPEGSQVRHRFRWGTLIYLKLCQGLGKWSALEVGRRKCLEEVGRSASFWSRSGKVSLIVQQGTWKRICTFLTAVRCDEWLIKLSGAAGEQWSFVKIHDAIRLTITWPGFTIPRDLTLFLRTASSAGIVPECDIIGAILMEQLPRYIGQDDFVESLRCAW